MLEVLVPDEERRPAVPGVDGVTRRGRNHTAAIAAVHHKVERPGPGQLFQVAEPSRRDERLQEQLKREPWVKVQSSRARIASWVWSSAANT